MEKLKKFFQEKSYGFYVTIGVSILTLVTLIVYATAYGKLASYMSWWGFAFMIVGIAAALALILFKQGKWAPAAIALFDFIALLLFIVYIYKYVIVVMVGIDMNTFSPQFIACTTLFISCFVISVANIFLKQEKKEGI